jgi:hypothetical protein
MLQYQDHYEGLRALPLKAMECAKCHTGTWEAPHALNTEKAYANPQALGVQGPPPKPRPSAMRGIRPQGNGDNEGRVNK